MKYLRKLSRKKKIELLFVLLLVLMIAFLLFPSSRAFKNNTFLQEFRSEISKQSLYVDSESIISFDALAKKVYDHTTESALKQYMHDIDTFGDYFTPREYQAFLEASNVNYAGVGMLLHKQKNSDTIICLPLQEMPIERYSRLLAVDTKSVKDTNIYTISSWIRGQKGSHVALEVKDLSGKIQTFNVERKAHYFSSVQWVKEGDQTMLQIVHFTQNTSAELKAAVKLWPKDIPLIIDLRDNGGGDFLSAVKSADLFLPKNSKISSLHTREKQFDYYANNADILNDQAVILLQNHLTASAAEVFIAALTQNFRAQSLGEKSYGKGVAQKFIEMRDHSAIYLTYANILTPNGKSYHKKGLTATYTHTLEDLLTEYIEEKIDD